MESLSDNALMLKVREGDLNRLGLLFERYKKMLFTFFYRMNHDPELSKDLVQNVFIRVLKYRASFRGTGPFKIWLFHIARNELYDHHRKSRMNIHTSLEGKHEVLSDHSEVRTAEYRDDHLKFLESALQRLDKEKRELIILSKLDGMRYREIGEILDCSEGAVKTKVFRALRDLKEEFENIRKYYG